MAYKDIFMEMSDEEVIDKVRCLFGIGSELRAEVDDEGLRISVGPGDTQPVILIRDILMGFLISTICARTGNLYTARFSTVVEDDTVIFSSKLYSASTYPLLGLTYVERGSSYYRVDHPFKVLYTNGGSQYLISNENMIKVLSSIDDGNSTPVDIAAATEIPHVTVHSVLNKLESMGVVSKTVSPRGLSFDPTYSTIIQGKSAPVDAPPYIDILDMGFDETKFRGFVYRYMFWVADSFGIGAEAIFRRIGECMGEVLATAGPKVSAQKFLESTCSSYAADGANITIVSFIPICIILRIESNGKFAEDVGVYIQSLLERALEIITGEHYNVIVDVR